MSPSNDPRILVVAPLAPIVEPLLSSWYPDGQIDLVTDPAHLRASVTGRTRFDVILLDLSWHGQRFERTFDGLDAVEILRSANRTAPCLVAIQGLTDEEDLVVEALDRHAYPEVSAIFDKTSTTSVLHSCIDAVVLGETVPHTDLGFVKRSPSLHDYFRTGRGRTAGLLAAAVATGRVSNYAELATLAGVAPDTANKLAGYLAPLLIERGDVPDHSKITQPVVYRWCGEHSRYLLSWARRHLDPRSGITHWKVPT